MVRRLPQATPPDGASHREGLVAAAAGTKAMSNRILKDTAVSITIEQIYGSHVTIPAGWRFVRIGFPEPGEYWITLGGTIGGPDLVSEAGALQCPRIIVSRHRRRFLVAELRGEMSNVFDGQNWIVIHRGDSSTPGCLNDVSLQFTIEERN